MNEVATVSPRSLIGLRTAGERLAVSVPRARAQQMGGYRSPFKGRGMEFEESRRYQAGDDIRNMDWRVTARTGEPHTKLFREERERPVLFGVDFRPAMFFATRGVFKSVMACRLAALLAWRSNHQGDRAGGVLWSGVDHRELRPKRGSRGVLGLISALCEFAAGPAASAAREAAVEDPTLEPMAARLRRVAHPGSLVFVLSDFRGFTQGARDLLSHTAHHCDLVFMFVHDPIEAELPPPGRYLIRDRGRELVIDTRSGRHRESYSAQFEARREAVQDFCRKSSIRLLTCPTVADPATLLRNRLSH
jgi:uncharacterized protein (DUF58 family)